MKVGDKVKIKNGAVASNGQFFNIENFNRTVKDIKGKSVQLNGDEEIWFWTKDIILIKSIPQQDTIVESVINQFRERSEVGIKKYGVTLDRGDLTPLQWAQHLQEELCDGILYLEKLKQTL